MRLGLEKARRRDRTSYRYDPIESFRLPKNHRHANHYAFSRPQSKRSVYPDKTLYLIIKGPNFTALAKWRRIRNCWGCFEADPKLSWMLNLDEKQAGIHLRYEVKYSGWSFSWTRQRPTLPHQDSPVKQAHAGDGALYKSKNTNPGNGVTKPSTSSGGKGCSANRGLPPVVPRTAGELSETRDGSHAVLPATSALSAGNVYPDHIAPASPFNRDSLSMALAPTAGGSPTG